MGKKSNDNNKLIIVQICRKCYNIKRDDIHVLVSLSDKHALANYWQEGILGFARAIDSSLAFVD